MSGPSGYGDISIFGRSREWIWLDDRHFLPRSFDAVVPQPDLECDVRLHIEVDDLGRPRVRELSVIATGVRDVAGDVMRALRIADLRRAAVASALGTVAEVSGTGVYMEAPTSPDDVAAFYDEFRSDRVPRRGSPVEIEHLERIAAQYRVAVERGLPPIKTIAAATPGVSRSTVARWVQTARSVGVLGAALPGRAGEDA